MPCNFLNLEVKFLNCDLLGVWKRYLPEAWRHIPLLWGAASLQLPSGTYHATYIDESELTEGRHLDSLRIWTSRHTMPFTAESWDFFWFEYANDDLQVPVATHTESSVSSIGNPLHLKGKKMHKILLFFSLGRMDCNYRTKCSQSVFSPYNKKNLSTSTLPASLRNLLYLTHLLDIREDAQQSSTNISCSIHNS